ncbi:uncharacterized protein LOC133784242 [Humulus lupulus]|uniref:uncharacterized protein LOC133784242 n=1 Tax=Humulus lupulus TaxID=3486 RepID=UPI002B40A168|nr:uncharacterized protein LOC133784242 [Humulus lupulus]
MSLTSKAWIVAASIGAVEAFKDQGICRWNYVLRSLQQNAKTNIRSSSQAIRSFSFQSVAVSQKIRDDKIKQSEDSLRTVMYLSCWGPNN